MKDDIIEHPLENLFNIESGSTDLDPYIDVELEKRNTQLVKLPEVYDTKDEQIEEQFQEIYDYAIVAYESQAKEIKLVEPKYRARNHEMAIQYLNTALNAVKEKSNLKVNKDKLYNDSKKIVNKTNVTNNNVLVGNRNDILKMLKSIDAEPLVANIIDQEPERIQTEEQQGVVLNKRKK